jgi:hypothetical protein
MEVWSFCLALHELDPDGNDLAVLLDYVKRIDSIADAG